MPVVPLDLADFSSIQRCAAQVLREEARLDFLILTAGVSGVSGRTSEAFEMQMGVNDLGHALLCHLLLPKMAAAAHTSRVIVVSSLGHRFGFVDTQLQSTCTCFFGWDAYLNGAYLNGAYLNSKLPNVLFPT